MSIINPSGVLSETSLTTAPIVKNNRNIDTDTIAQGSVLMEEQVKDKKTGKIKKFMIAIPFNPTIKNEQFNQDQEKNRPAFQFFKDLNEY